MMKTACFTCQQNDLPSDEPDWIDDFITTLDGMQYEETANIRSSDALLLKLGLAGYGWDLDYKKLWIALFAYLKWNCSPERLQLEAMAKITRNSIYSLTSKHLQFSTMNLQHQGRGKWRRLAGNLLDDFIALDYETKSQIFEYADRLSGSTSEFDYEVDVFKKKLQEQLIPEDDIPEA